MGRVPGKIIHRDYWNNHLVEVIDNGDARSLYFAGNILQSTMSLSVPHRLVLSYTRFMMATLLFNSAPGRVLMIGVGAGSMLRYIHHYCPTCFIDAIDYSAHILGLAKGYFNLPKAENINILCRDGYDFLSSRTGKPYDLILIDAFDQTGMAPTIYCQSFFKLCRTHLKQTGLVSLNVWSGNEKRMAEVKKDLSRHFNSLVEMPVPNRGNVVCLAGKSRMLADLMEKDYTELTNLSTAFEISFKEIVKVCVKHNLDFKQRVVRFFSG